MMFYMITPFALIGIRVALTPNKLNRIIPILLFICIT
jgi:hypothetical protein